MTEKLVEDKICPSCGDKHQGFFRECKRCREIRDDKK